jgi:glycosyltransferase involved in cell wall biosynthesis
MRRVLWLSSWYPNAVDPFTGDFIKRQAEALSLIQPLKIVFAGKYPSVPEKQPGSITEVFPNLQEYILYYPSTSKDNIVSRVRSVITYFRRHSDFIRQLKHKNELPDIVHVQVAFKAGLIALYLKWKYKIPYVLTEHWSGYYQQAKDSLFRRSFLEKYVTRLIIKHAAVLITVSKALGDQIQQYWLDIPYRKIPNVVNTRLFYPQESKTAGRFRFIHISTLRYPKNPEGILRAFIALIQEAVDSELVFVGPANPGLEKMILDAGLPLNAIRCTGEISYEQVGIELRNSSALILFSFYENMPCVMLESLCSGIPVIASRVGGIPEVIGNENGILVNAGDEKELLEAMRTMIHKAHFYDQEKIRERAATCFSYEAVGREILAVYDNVLGHS